MNLLLENRGVFKNLIFENFPSDIVNLKVYYYASCVTFVENQNHLPNFLFTDQLKIK